MSIDNVADITPRIQYTAVAAETDFDYPFPIYAETDLVVDVDGVTKVLTTDYTVSGVQADLGGTVTFVTPMAGGEVITIYRDMTIERLTDFQQHGPFSSTSFNDELDRMTLIDQNLRSLADRAIRFPVTAEAGADDLELSPLSNWLGKYLRISASGVPEPAEVTSTALSQSVIGAHLYPQTAAEASAGVTPVNYAYEPGDVRRYGAVGDGITDDTLAVQNACSANRLVFGDKSQSYLIDSHRIQWTEDDLHRVSVSGGTPVFSNGYYCGVTVPTGTILKDLHFVLTGDGDLTRGAHGFGVGDSTSVSAHSGSGFRGCKFTVSGSAPAGYTQQWRCFVAQTVDDFVFYDCVVEGTTENIIGGYLFDCQRASVMRNKMHEGYVLAVFEYCSNCTFSENIATESEQLVDLDKMDSGISLSGNVFARVSDFGDSADAVFEIGACNGISLVGNLIRNARRYLLASGKANLYPTWADALAGTGTPAFQRSHNISSKGNVCNGSSLQAAVIGDRWDISPHSGVVAISHVTLEDTYTDCGQSLTDDQRSAVVTIDEGTEIVVACLIDGSAGRGLSANAYVESEYAGAGTYSGLSLTIGGSIRDTEHEGVDIDMPDMVHFSNAQLIGCGTTGLIAALLREPHGRSATIDGSIYLDDDGSAATIGFQISGTDYSAAAFDFRCVVVSRGFSATRGFELVGTATSNTNVKLLPGSYVENVDTSFFQKNGDPVPATFAASDATPSVLNGKTFRTDTGSLTITDFDDGQAGQEITVISNGAVTFDTTGTDLTGSSVDLVTASGDITRWISDDGTTWRLIAFVDASADNSGGA